jgi:hypothetical protein
MRLTREDKENFPPKLVANPKGQYMVDGNAFGSRTHEQVQAVTTLRIGKIVIFLI